MSRSIAKGVVVAAGLTLATAVSAQEAPVSTGDGVNEQENRIVEITWR